MRIAEINRETRETQILMKVNLDGTGKAKIDCPIGFLSHMLETFARHSLIDLEATVFGDLHVDQHHTVEDCGIVLGEVLKKALGDKRGIQRAGFFVYPMDEALTTVAIDISGRPFLKLDAAFSTPAVGEFQIELLEDFLLGFTTALAANLHILVHYGRSDHHKIEAIFKGLARAMKTACSIEPRVKNLIPSTKGVL